MSSEREETEIITVRPDSPEPEAIERAAQIIRAGGLIAFPTETVYGLGANALNSEAVAGIFRAKGRPTHNPLIVHVADVAGAQQVVAEWTETASRLAERFWAGPLTLVLPKSPNVPDIVTAGGATVAVRVPAHPVAQALLEAAGVPIAAPSANRSNQLSPTRAEHVYRSLGGRIPLILDGGATTGGLESTVLDLTTSPPRILRPGLVSPLEIEAVIGRVLRPGESVPAKGVLPSPGMLARHYAPRVPLIVATDSGWELAQASLDAGERVGWLTFTPEREALGLTTVVMPRDAAKYSARLFAELHALDATGVERIIVACPPEGDAWLAVHDRLRRAAAALDADEDSEHVPS